MTMIVVVFKYKFSGEYVDEKRLMRFQGENAVSKFHLNSVKGKFKYYNNLRREEFFSFDQTVHGNGTH